MTMRRTHATNKMSRMSTIIHIIENAYQSVQINYCYRLRYHKFLQTLENGQRYELITP